MDSLKSVMMTSPHWLKVVENCSELATNFKFKFHADFFYDEQLPPFSVFKNSSRKLVFVEIIGSYRSKNKLMWKLLGKLGVHTKKLILNGAPLESLKYFPNLQELHCAALSQLLYLKNMPRSIKKLHVDLLYVWITPKLFKLLHRLDLQELTADRIVVKNFEKEKIVNVPIFHVSDDVVEALTEFRLCLSHGEVALIKPNTVNLWKIDSFSLANTSALTVYDKTYLKSFRSLPVSAYPIFKRFSEVIY